MKNKLAYYVALSAAPGIGPARFQLLLKFYQTPEKVWNLPNKEAASILGEKLGETFLRFRDETNPENLLSDIEKRGIRVISLDDNNYPKLLKNIDLAPTILYVKGTVFPNEARVLAVVGSRKVTNYGKEVTESLVSQLAGAGFTIVSGLARGVDSLAHQAALKAGTRTIAVLGGGLSRIYPAENEKLASEIERNGAVISEYLPQQPSVPGNFPARNRIISGLSLGVLVTEAAEDSGSLITAGFAAEQGREVFAVPGPIHSRLTKGPASLIKEGAKLVMSAQDILEELNLELRVNNEKFEKDVKGDSKEEQTVIDLLVGGSAHIDEIIRKTDWEAKKVSSLLSMLEIKKKIKHLGSGNYSLFS